MLVIRRGGAHPVGVGRAPVPVPLADVVLATTLGLPNALASRQAHGMKSMAALPAGVATGNTTASGPCRALISASRAAVIASASSHEIRAQPGSGSPLGRVRTIGYRRRSGA